MRDKVIKELNKFLTGVHMGGATFKDYLDKAENLELKSTLKEIIESFKKHEEAITHRIEELGGNASDSLGIRGNIAEAFEKIKLIPVDTDCEVCEHAIKAMEMGNKNANKFIEENENMEKSILSTGLSGQFLYIIQNQYIDQLIEMKEIVHFIPTHRLCKLSLKDIGRHVQDDLIRKILFHFQTDRLCQMCFSEP